MRAREKFRSVALLFAILTLLQPVESSPAVVQELISTGVSGLVAGPPSCDDSTLLWTSTPDCSNAPGDELRPALINRASLAIASPRAVFAFNPARPVATCNPYRLLSNVYAFGPDLYYIDNQGPDGHAGLWRRPRDANLHQPSQFLADVAPTLSAAEIVVFGGSVIAILNRPPLSVIVQYDKDTGALLNGNIEFGASGSLGSLRYDRRYLYWVNVDLGALRRNDTTNGELLTVLNGPLQSLYTYGYGEECDQKGNCFPTSRILFGQDNSLYEAETVSGEVRPVYTSPVLNGRVIDIERGPLHYYFIERRTVSGGFDLEDRFFRLPLGSFVPDLIYGPINNGGPGFDGFRTDFTWLYFRDRANQKLLRLPNFEAAIPTYDLRATDLEVTQGLQNSANALRLIQDKRTLVRFYVRSGSGVDVPGVTASLAGSNEHGFLGRLEPVNTVGKLINVLANPTRTNLDHSFQFELPRHWTNAGRLSLTATVNPFERLMEDTVANNSASRDVDFSPSERLLVIYYNWSFDLGGMRHTPVFDDVAASRRRMRRLYPIGEPGDAFESPGLHTVVLDFIDNELTDQVDQTDAGCVKRYEKTPGDRNNCASDYVHGRMMALRQGSNIAVGAVSYGNIAQAPAPMGLSYFTRGYANGQFASGPSNDPNYGPHEVGHVLGRAHPLHGALTCGHSASDPNYPHNGARIDTIPSDAATRYQGLDFADTLPGTMTLLDAATTYDTMSYCSPYWISDYTFEGMYQYLISEGRPRLVQRAPRQAVAGDWLILFGTLDPEDNEGGFVVVQRTDSVMDATAPVAGGFTLELRNGAGGLLASHPFTANAVDDEPGKLVFNLVVPFVPGTAQLRAVEDATQRALATMAVSANAPLESDVQLPGAPNPVDGVVTVTWNASDPDGDPLTFGVFASRDGGASYRPIHLGIEGSSVSLDTSMLGGGQNKLRVVASDGVQTAYAESATFTVPARPPKVIITSPVDGFHADWGQLVSLQVEVDDVQDDFIPNAQISWTGSQTGVFASGRWVQTDQLPVGENVLEVAAVNSLGASATASVTVVVGDVLVPPGPTLSVAPQSIGWHVAADDGTTQVITLAVENHGSGTLEFDVTSDAGWLLVDSATAVAGATAPRTFTVSAAPMLVPPSITSRATLTIENTADPNDVVVVPVALSRGNVFDHTGEQPVAGCAGDCDSSDSVGIDELVRGVNIALGNTPLSECGAFDTNRDGQVSINELISAVIAALQGC